MMDKGGKKRSRDISIIMGNISRCMYFYSILLRNTISINSFRSSMRLVNYRCLHQQGEVLNIWKGAAWWIRAARKGAGIYLLLWGTSAGACTSN